MITLRAEGLGHRFGNRVLFRKLSFDLSGGTSTAITGANGSGKSTLLKILAGVLRPVKGRIELRTGTQTIEPAQRPFECGFVAPYLNVYDGLTFRENLAFLCKARGLDGANERIQAVVQEVGLEDRADERVETFSSGMVQRVRLAGALLSDPPVLLLDEPTATLDEAGAAMVRLVIRRAIDGGKVVVVATNEPGEAAACERAFRIEDYRK